MTSELWQLDATELASHIRAGKVSAREATQAHLQRLGAVNPKLNAVVHQFPEQALADADAADRLQRSGTALGPLHGVPITIKITADQKGQAADNGLRILKNHLAEHDAPVVRNLKEAGAIVIGRTNAPAFAMRLVTNNMLHGRTLNPWDRNVTCGGSSGGAGAATAAGIGTFAHGTDIGGSIRWPAYCNGIVGLRTTPGRIPMYNRSTTTPTRMAAQLMAVPGPMARSVRDARLGFEVMAGRGHPGDPLWLPVPLRGSPLSRPTRVALVTERLGTDVDASALAAVRQAGSYLRDAGYIVEEITPPGFVRAFELWDDIGMHEIRAALEPMLPVVDDEELTRTMTAWWATRKPVTVTDYWAALAERHTLMRQWNEFMETYPLIITPVSAVHTMLPDHDARDMGYVIDKGFRYLLQAPLLGLPVLAMPIGQHNGQPQGVQIYAPKFREDICLDAGEVIEAHEGVRSPIDPRW